MCERFSLCEPYSVNNKNTCLLHALSVRVRPMARGQGLMCAAFIARNRVGSLYPPAPD